MSVDLVCGASGFVGSHLVDRLLEQGRNVRLLLRTTSSLRWVQEDRVEIVRLGKWTASALTPIVEGVDRFFLVAGVTHARKRSDFFRFHVDVTKNLLDACCDTSSPPSRIVVFSSLAAAGPSTTGRPLVEDDPPNPVSWYGRSKLEQERVAASYCDRLHIVVIRPPALYGPRDRDFLPLFRAASLGFYPAPGGGSALQSFTYVEDVVNGACLAGTRDVPSGSVYFISSHEIATWKAVGNILGAVFSRPVRQVYIPLWIVPLAGFMGEVSNRLFRTKSPLDRNKAMEGRFPHWTCSPARAARELGYTTSVDLSEGIRRTIRWYRNEQWLQSSEP
jgi:nucleoside-diphosphate-sugar epimerase